MRIKSSIVVLVEDLANFLMILPVCSLASLLSVYCYAVDAWDVFYVFLGVQGVEVLEWRINKVVEAFIKVAIQVEVVVHAKSIYIF